MKTVTFGVFAHPDDEAFGPSATLYKLAKSGSDVHLILVTDGDSGYNAGYDDLAATRLAEWEQSCKLIGVNSKIALHYPDGGLSNNLYHEICKKAEEFIYQVLDKYEEPVELDFITFDFSGITGHLDHIAVSYMTTHIYLKLKDNTPKNFKVGKLKYFCIPESMQPKSDNSWVFMPCGCNEDKIDEVVDYSDIVEIKMNIMRSHESQKADLDRMLKVYYTGDNPSCYKDHFAYHK
ncbi:MAG: PIG-L family deacetylase [bacterium]|nr:PIG-L family deacetylase [bacterium]